MGRFDDQTGIGASHLLVNFPVIEKHRADQSGFLWSDSNFERFQSIIRDFDSLDFDDEGKSIEKLMLKHLNHGGFGIWVICYESRRS